MLVDATSVKTPGACARPEIVLDFLRASRKVSDDNIRNRLGQVDCATAIQEVYSEWKRRDSVLEYCKRIKGTFDDSKTENKPISWLVEHSRDHIKFAETKTDPRVDAYSSRDETTLLNPSFDWIGTEEIAETIIRDSTMQTITRKCGFGVKPYEK